eukprot:CAMPEP_0177394350 /NCGR_PEP_ID=MMETSP0368-20130122/55484_1 /TAXON_ID=447022 ORGANISM="Scrippsiella hangoei-like, Strain SHHI-4" /NCGR_SAMPLE_ID=MMETSP0368 /ASSEMBLY_ACC=CAM_ASM_000363 /LENGTH=229 /DNA_ID=CAMNT_0018860687 /DNA_START=20 /DNA_END=709 /DNA_ORIENTATION=-
MSTVSAGELRWQQEALRLRDELADARRAWRSVDARSMMRRDRELRHLGLDSRALEERMQKGDLVAILLELCRILKVGSLSSLVFAATNLCAPTSIDSRPSQSVQTAGPVVKPTSLSAAGDIVTSDAEIILCVMAKLQCDAKEVPGRISRLLSLCDQYVAAERIVEALRKLLHVDAGIAAILPALKEVLDVSALRRRRTRLAAASVPVGAVAAAVPPTSSFPPVVGGSVL